MDNQRVYRTARGAYSEALRAGLAAAVMLGIMGFMLATFGTTLSWATNTYRSQFLWSLGIWGFFGLVFLRRAIWYILVAKNSYVMISDSGLSVVNSRARRDLIPWEKILGLVQRDYLGAFWDRGWLMVKLQDGVDGRERMTIARYYCRRPAALDELRDEIIKQRDLSLVRKPPRSAAGRAVEWLSGGKERTWR